MSLPFCYLEIGTGVDVLLLCRRGVCYILYQKGWLMDGPEEERSWHLGPNRPLLSRADLFIIKFGPIFLLHQTK